VFGWNTDHDQVTTFNALWHPQCQGNFGSDGDDNGDPNGCGITSGVNDEDSWDVDIKFDSQLLLSVVNDSTNASPTTEADVHALEEPSKPAEIGEWFRIWF